MTPIKYYDYKDNRLNDNYLKIDDTYFRLSNISSIGPIIYRYNNSNVFIFICDGKSFETSAYEDKENKKLEKIHKDIIERVFPKIQKEEKNYI